MRIDLHESFVHHVRKFKKWTRDAYELPNPEDIHKLRVLTQKLRAMVWLAKQSNDKKSLRDVAQNLKYFCKILGERRKWDVASMDACHYHANLDRIETKKHLTVHPLMKLLKPKRIDKLIKKLKAVEKHFEKIPNHDLVQSLKRVESELTRSPENLPDSKPDRHRIRIQLKKVRYLLECFGHKVPLLETMQDYLGKEHDLTILQSMVGLQQDITSDAEKAVLQAHEIFGMTFQAAKMELKTARLNLEVH